MRQPRLNDDTGAVGGSKRVSRSEDDVQARLKVAAGTVGLTTPSVAIHFRLQRKDEDWQLMAWTPEPGHEAKDLIPWFEAQRGLAPLTACDVQGPVLNGLLPAPGEPWDRVLGGFELHHVVVRPNGRVELTVNGHRKALRAFTKRLADEDPSLEVAQVHPTDRATGTHELLTGRQAASLRAAFQAGYYDVPRRVRLRDLAEQLDTSAAALSELLRRAEARLVEHHLIETRGPERPDDATGDVATLDTPPSSHQMD